MRPHAGILSLFVALDLTHGRMDEGRRFNGDGSLGGSCSALRSQPPLLPKSAPTHLRHQQQQRPFRRGVDVDLDAAAPQHLPLYDAWKQVALFSSLTDHTSLRLVSKFFHRIVSEHYVDKCLLLSSMRYSPHGTFVTVIELPFTLPSEFQSWRVYFAFMGGYESLLGVVSQRYKLSLACVRHHGHALHFGGCYSMMRRSHSPLKEVDSDDGDDEAPPSLWED